MYILIFLQIIAERKQYHENTDGQYLKHLKNDIEIDDTEIIGSMYTHVYINVQLHQINIQIILSI